MKFLPYYDDGEGADTCFFKRLDKKLGQEHLAGDDDDFDDWKIVPLQDGKYRTYEAMISLLNDNKLASWEDFTYTFTKDTDTLNIPEYIHHIHGYYDGGYPKLFEGATGLESLSLISERKIKYSNGWTKGDTIKLIVTKKPSMIITDADPVEFPPEHYELLMYHILSIAMGDKQKAMGAVQQQHYLRLLMDWQERKGPVTKMVRVKKRVRSFGYRGR